MLYIAGFVFLVLWVLCTVAVVALIHSSSPAYFMENGLIREFLQVTAIGFVFAVLIFKFALSHPFISIGLLILAVVVIRIIRAN